MAQPWRRRRTQGAPAFLEQAIFGFLCGPAGGFGATNYPAAIEHYVSTGHSEGREGVLALTPNVFDLSFYTSTNPDVQSLSTVDAETFWIEHGKIGRAHV